MNCGNLALAHQVAELLTHNKQLQIALQAKQHEVEALKDVAQAASHVAGAEGPQADKVIELAKKVERD